MEKHIIYTHEDKSYDVLVRYKRMNSIRFYYRDGSFIVSCPYLVSLDTIKNGLGKYYDSLVKKDAKSLGLTDKYIYLFGDKIFFEDDKDKAIKECFDMFVNYVTEKTKYYEMVMGGKKHIIKVKSLKSKYGSNDIHKNIIEYASILMHYGKEIIDSVIIHEIAHDFVKGHQKNFYEIVYKYCPNYKDLHNRLRKGEF